MTARTDSHHIVNDVTQLNPVRVMAIVAPSSVEDVQDALRRTSGPVSVGGGRFSMGGQTASPGSLHFDMRGMNRVVSFAPERKQIRVQAGMRWCDMQRFVDPHGLAVKIMQTYANFTVGGGAGRELPWPIRRARAAGAVGARHHAGVARRHRGPGQP